MDAITKTCTKCGAEKALQEYHRQPLGKHGHTAQCKDCTKVYRKAYRDKPENKARMSAYLRAYNASPEGKAVREDYHTAYFNRPENRDRRKEYKRAYMKNRRQTDPRAAMLNRLRTRLHNALNGRAKTESTMALVGCSPEKLCAWLEMHFDVGMTWENRSEWHIDHIRPVASFDDPQDPECWHWSNLQPLWAEDNMRKGDKY
jgi:hypothetical protein